MHFRVRHGVFAIAYYVQINKSINLKGRVHCFSMQVGINKCFLLNPEKKFGADPSCRFRKKKTQKTYI